MPLSNLFTPNCQYDSHQGGFKCQYSHFSEGSPFNWTMISVTRKRCLAIWNLDPRQDQPSAPTCQSDHNHLKLGAVKIYSV
jgi:hypothetical protein